MLNTNGADYFQIKELEMLVEVTKDMFAVDRDNMLFQLIRGYGRFTIALLSYLLIRYICYCALLSSVHTVDIKTTCAFSLSYDMVCFLLH